MSNILIIKHGSLGDLIQANGAFADIKNSFKSSKVLLLTTQNFASFMSECPYLDGVLVDKRLPRWNLLYLSNLKKLLERYNFSHVFDLQKSTHQCQPACRRPPREKPRGTSDHTSVALPPVAINLPPTR